MTAFQILNKITTDFKFFKFDRKNQPLVMVKYIKDTVPMHVQSVQSNHIIAFTKKGERKKIPYHLLSDWDLGIILMKLKKMKV
jgi:hypothetical protein